MATSTAPRKRNHLTACDSQVQSEVWSRIICQLCDLRMIAVSAIPDNALLRKLRVLHLTKFWIFPLLTRIVCCLANPRQQLFTINFPALIQSQ